MALWPDGDYTTLALVITTMAGVWPLLVRGLKTWRGWGRVKTGLAVHLPIVGVVWVATLFLTAHGTVTSSLIVVLPYLLRRTTGTIKNLLFRAL